MTDLELIASYKNSIEKSGEFVAASTATLRRLVELAEFAVAMEDPSLVVSAEVLEPDESEDADVYGRTGTGLETEGDSQRDQTDS